MARPLDDYALIGDTHTAALVGSNGAIDWLCVPRFDSGACFTALLGGPENGYWSLTPVDEVRAIERDYAGDSLVLRTRFVCAGGSVLVTDCMPLRGEQPDLVRRVEGVSGRVRMRSDFVPRFDYGHILPAVRRDGRRLEAMAGPDHLVLDSDVDFDLGDPDRPRAEFTVGEGDVVTFRMSWCHPRQDRPRPLDVHEAIEKTTRWWQEWAHHCHPSDYREPVVRSLITLKALIYQPSGGIIAAPTTSLPEELGGVRNWDYRYCWIRDASFTLLALLAAGYEDEAKAWREWLLRTLAGRPEQMRVVYGIDGERRLTELELDWLSGYAGSRPVRIGNGAAEQFQLDVYGQLMDVLHHARSRDVPPDAEAWEVQAALMDFLESRWRDPDNGIWEVRGPRRQFTHSKVLAWAAADRAVQAVSRFGLDGPVQRWRRLRREIFDEVCDKAFDARRGTFTQYYGSTSLDAALLEIPRIGFLPATDERMLGTTAAIERELCVDGLVHRYTMDAGSEEIDGLPPGEGAFLPCSFWLADCLILQGEVDRGRRLFEHLLSLRSDTGLLSEEYDTAAGQLTGNYPQALSHISLVHTAFNLTTANHAAGDGGSATGPPGRASRESRTTGQSRQPSILS